MNRLIMENMDYINGGRGFCQFCRASSSLGFPSSHHAAHRG